MKKNIVFVVGAGASREVNLPTGSELKDQIAKMLDIRFDYFGQSLESGDYDIVQALRKHVVLPDGRGGNINPYLSEALHIRDALPQAISIDNFIDTQRGNKKIALCGKLAIVQSILEAERKSLLHFEKTNQNSNMDFDAIFGTWYTPFFQLLTENCSKDDLEKRFNSITLIVFNYDRCIEHFVYHALQNYYKVSEKEASELVSKIKIYHPYGDVGILPWIDRLEAVEFGLKPHPAQLLKIANKIKTFTEGTDPNSSEILEIRKKITLADKLVFLGFAFHNLNMDLLWPGRGHEKRTTHVKCFATALDISPSDQLVIQGQIEDLYAGKIDIKMSNVKCAPFFYEFRRSLAF